MTTNAILISNLCLALQGKTIFSNFNLELPAGCWSALLGPSGIGKTVLLRAIMGLNADAHKSGSILLNGKPVYQQAAYMAQTDLLLPWLTVLDNVLIGDRLQNKQKHFARQFLETALHLLDKAGLAKTAHLYPHQLSGGMRQRAALVRTLLQDKPVILMDEPFSALDAVTRHSLQNLAAELLRNKTVILVTHDPAEAVRLADTIYIMHGSPAAVTVAAHLTSLMPRDLSEPTILNAQKALLQQLLDSHSEAA